jgi:hypothetical protein
MNSEQRLGNRNEELHQLVSGYRQVREELGQEAATTSISNSPVFLNILDLRITYLGSVESDLTRLLPPTRPKKVENSDWDLIENTLEELDSYLRALRGLRRALRALVHVLPEVHVAADAAPATSSPSSAPPTTAPSSPAP